MAFTDAKGISRDDMPELIISTPDCLTEALAGALRTAANRRSPLSVGTGTLAGITVSIAETRPLTGSDGEPLWPSGIGGAQCGSCGETTIVRPDLNDEDELICRACAEGFYLDE